MPLNLTATLEGAKELDRTLMASVQGLKTFEKPLTQSRDHMMTEIDKSFETEGANLGMTWAPLAPEYAERKAKLFPGKGILEATGRMRQGFVSRVTSTLAEIWNAVDYFAYHQSRGPRAKLPRRPMMALTEEAKRQIVRFFQEYLESFPGWRRVS